MDTTELTDRDWDTRTAIYEFIIAIGRAPTSADLAQRLDLDPPDVLSILRRLAACHQLVLVPGGTELWMVHPFSAIPTDFPVESEGRGYWANCAWDALGIAAVLHRDTWTRTRCGESGTPIEFGIRDGQLVAGETVVHFVVPPSAFYENVAFT